MTKLFRIAIAAAFALAYGTAYAFHSGGVAECNGCHTMHASYEGEAPVGHEAIRDGAGNITTPETFPLTHLQAGPYLLKGNDQSSACLNCHAGTRDRPNSYHMAEYPLPAAGAPPTNLTPGGDFAWLRKTYTWQPRVGTTETSPGDRHGHNIVATDYGYGADATLTTAPGGTYPAAAFACSSCHDPHGKYRRLADGSFVDGKAEPTLPIKNSGSYASSADPVANVYAVGTYRLLPGIGYQPKSLSGSFSFAAPPPNAVANSNYNVPETTAINRVAYGSGMSEFCGNCHTDIHRDTYTSGTPGLTHPAGDGAKLPLFIKQNYNDYVVTGNLSGDVATSYSTLAPFEEGSADYAALKAHTGNYRVGPSETGTAENVSCMSCHRAHASGFDSILRFSLHYEFMTDGDATGGAQTYGDASAPVDSANNQKRALAQGKTTAESEAAYYGRPATAFAPFQRALCNKCHLKD